MPRIHLRSQMKYLLLEGPVGIGEHHLQPAARLFVADLIDRGLVKRMFVEYQTGWQGRMDNLKNALMADPRDVNAANVERHFFFWNQQFRLADTPLIDLCAIALMNGADVWCSDHWIGGGAPRFPTRHQSVRDTYQVKTKGVHPKGSVILFGSNHFTDPDHGLDQYIPDLPYYVF